MTLTWIATFVLHSTLWCLAAWATTLVFPRMSPAVRETLWYGAIATSLITSSLQTCTGLSAPLWEITLPLTVGEEHIQDEAPASWLGEHAVSAFPWIATAWITISSILIVTYVVRLMSLYRRIGRRIPIQNTHLNSILDEFASVGGFRTPPKLTSSVHLASPIAIGTGARREICIPLAMVRSLEEPQQRALIGHEVAHHARYDVIRLFFLNVLQAVLFFQPLFRVAAKSIQNSADEQCDAWSARLTGDQHAMASCLLEVADWSFKPKQGALVPRMTSGRSALAKRIDRLLSPTQRVAPRHRGIVVLAACLMMVGGVTAPEGVPHANLR